MLAKLGKRIDTFFRSADRDGNNSVELAELKKLFTDMKVKLTDSELQNIFSSIDFDMSGKLTYAEFISDFNKTVQTDTQTLLHQEKERYEGEVRATSYNRTMTSEPMGAAGRPGTSAVGLN